MSKVTTGGNPEFEKFDAVMSKILSVPRKELQEREKKYQRKRAKKKLEKANLK
jgi:hypothetical protein